MKNAVKRRLQIMTVLFSLAVFSFAWSIPVCAEESTEPAEVTQEEMDKAYDDAMMYGDSELTFLTMEEANYWLTVLMKYASGNLTEADFAELKDPDSMQLLELDDLIALSDSFIKETEIQADLSEYEDAVSSWKAFMEDLSGDTKVAAADELFDQLPLESRADYLEAAYNVDTAVWNILKSELGDSLSALTGLVSDISPYVEKGAETISNAFTVIDKIKTFLSVGSDQERYDKRLSLQQIKTKFTLLQQILLAAGRVTETVWAVEEPEPLSATETESEAAAQSVLSGDVVPVTWEVTPEHPMIDSDEARALYKQIKANDYPTIEELRNHPVVAQLDALSAYYKELYGNTADIHTPEREALREETKEWFLSQGSARTDRIDENGKHHYVYDGTLNQDYELELVLGLPASGKSTMVTDPDSEEMGAFILDCDMIKEQLPEYKESHGAAADAIHFEGYGLMLEAMKEFLKGGSMEGTNVILPIVSSDLDDLMETFIKPFESAGYHVKAKFCAARPNEAAARVVMRELGGGQLINSNVAFGFGNAPEEVYKELSVMLNSFGEPYGTDVEAEDLAA